MQILSSLKIASQGLPKGLSEAEQDVYVDEINEVSFVKKKRNEICIIELLS